MTPDNPQDPQKGKVDEAAVPEEAKDSKTAPSAAEAAEQPEPKPKRSRKKATPEAEGTAAAETGVDKATAAARVRRARGRSPSRAARRKAEDESPGRAPTPRASGRRGGERDGAARPTQEAVARPRPPKRDRRRRPEPGVLVRAQARYVRTSARKARLVCDHIRGKDVAEARAILAFTPRAAATPWLKLLESAVANAEHNHELVGEDLKIVSVHADEGPTLKRFRPRAMGRATRIRKRTSHLTITLTPKER